MALENTPGARAYSWLFLKTIKMPRSCNRLHKLEIFTLMWDIICLITKQVQICLWSRVVAARRHPGLTSITKIIKKRQIQTKQLAQNGPLALPPFYSSSGSSTAKIHRSWLRRLLCSRDSTIKKVGWEHIFTRMFQKSTSASVCSIMVTVMVDRLWFSYRLNKTGTIIKRRMWNYIHKNIHYRYPSTT